MNRQEQTRFVRSFTGLIVVLMLCCSRSASAQLSPFNSISDAVKQMTVDVSAKVAEARQAEERAATLQVQANAVVEKALAQAPLQAQATTETAQKKADEAKVAAEKAALVPDSQRQLLLVELKEFNAGSKAAASKYSTAAFSIVVAGLMLSLVTALAGFSGWSRIAGGLSIVVGAVIAVPKAIPVNERASYYRILDAGSANVLLDVELRAGMSVDDYADAVRRLKVLVEYEAAKYPAGGDIGEITRGLLNDLKPSQPVIKTSMR